MYYQLSRPHQVSRLLTVNEKAEGVVLSDCWSDRFLKFVPATSKFSLQSKMSNVSSLGDMRKKVARHSAVFCLGDTFASLDYVRSKEFPFFRLWLMQGKAGCSWRKTKRALYRGHRSKRWRIWTRSHRPTGRSPWWTAYAITSRHLWSHLWESSGSQWRWFRISSSWRGRLTESDHHVQKRLRCRWRALQRCYLSWKSAFYKKLRGRAGSSRCIDDQGNLYAD